MPSGAIFLAALSSGPAHALSWSFTASFAGSFSGTATGTAITDGAAAIQGEMIKELPDLVTEIVTNNGTWPVPTSRSHLQMMHHLARYWARRFMRNILLGLVHNHRNELAAARNEPRPAPYRADDLDKELKNAGDVNGSYLMEDHKRAR